MCPPFFFFSLASRMSFEYENYATPLPLLLPLPICEKKSMYMKEIQIYVR